MATAGHSLNPLRFGASILTGAEFEGKEVAEMGLNPLRFGASILTRAVGDPRRRFDEVSIPFDSGHRF